MCPSLAGGEALSALLLQWIIARKKVLYLLLVFSCYDHGQTGGLWSALLLSIGTGFDFAPFSAESPLNKKY